VEENTIINSSETYVVSDQEIWEETRPSISRTSGDAQNRERRIKQIKNQRWSTEDEEGIARTVPVSKTYREIEMRRRGNGGDRAVVLQGAKFIDKLWSRGEM
jgi:hypothetical protein